MKVYKYTVELSFFVSLLSFILSLVFCFANSNIGIWFENILIGTFASSLLLAGASSIGYLVEERKTCVEYYWKLQSLRSKILFLSVYFKDLCKKYEDYIEIWGCAGRLLLEELHTGKSY